MEVALGDLSVEVGATHVVVVGEGTRVQGKKEKGKGNSPSSLLVWPS